MGTKKVKLEDFLEQKESVKHLQVAIPETLYLNFKRKLKERDLSAQEILLAGIKLFLAEHT